MVNNFPEYNLTLTMNRKMLTTMRRRDPAMAGDVANMLCHRKTTADRYYNITDQRKTSQSTFRWIVEGKRQQAATATIKWPDEEEGAAVVTERKEEVVVDVVTARDEQVCRAVLTAREETEEVMRSVDCVVEEARAVFGGESSGSFRRRELGQ